MVGPVVCLSPAAWSFVVTAMVATVGTLTVVEAIRIRFVALPSHADHGRLSVVSRASIPRSIGWIGV